MTLGALVVLPLVVAGALLISGISKIGQTDATLATMRDLRIPVVAGSRLVARLVPWGEILVGLGVLLLPDLGYLVAAWAAVVLLAGLTVLVVASVARGDEVDCNCFGRLGGERLGPAAIVRNAVLLVAAIATALGAAGTRGVIATVGAFDASDLAWLGAAALVAAAAAAIILTAAPREQPALPTAGVPIPEIELVDELGRSVLLPSLVTTRAVVLLFLKTDCGACSTVARQVPEWTERLGDSVQLVFPTSASPEEFAAAYPETAGRRLYAARALRRELGISFSPAAVVLGRDRIVATDPVLGADVIPLLMDDLIGAVHQ